MHIKADQLIHHLSACQRQGSLAPLYVLTGDEPLQKLEAADAIRQQARQLGFSERIVMQVERSFSWHDLAAHNQALSLFGDKKIIELNLPSGKPGKEGSAALIAYAKDCEQQPNPDNMTLITLPRLDAATQKSAWFDTLSRVAVTVRIDPIERHQLAQWIGQRLALQQQKAPREALQFIADRVEGNLLAAHQEIQKLGLLHPTGELSLQAIQAAVLDVARYDVFKLNEAMLAGDAARLIRMLHGLRGEGEAEVLVLWAMTEEIRTLCKVKAGLSQGKPLFQLLREHRVWGPREKLIEPALKRLKQSVLDDALILAAQIDQLTKGLKVPGLPLNAWDALETLGLKLVMA